MKELTERFFKWLAESNIVVEPFKNNQFLLPKFGKILLIAPKAEYIVDKSCCLNLDDQETIIVEAGEIDFLVFEFGQRFYYSSIRTYKDEFNEIKYKSEFNDLKFVGECNDPFSDIDFVHLGIHTEYELLNGSHNSANWIKKTKFLKQKAVGICDLNTLAGTLGHQLACKKEGLKSILGQSISVAHKYDEALKIQSLYEIKLYVKDQIGWQNILQINKAINVDFNGFIPESLLLERGEGLICVISKESYFNYIIDEELEAFDFITRFTDCFGMLYYQIDTVEFYDDNDDVKYLQKIKKYLNNYREFLQPVLINDSYYLEREMFQLKEYLNKVDRKVRQYSEEQHYKTLGESYEKLSKLFPDSVNVYFEDLFNEMIENTLNISKQCNFEIEVGNPKLPRYEFAVNQTNVELFYELIEMGVAKKLMQKENLDEYIERITTECDVIVGAGFVDYFLILWDVVKWSKGEGIYVGTGRGCFIPETKVTMQDGSQKQINEINKGDFVKNHYLQKGTEVVDIFKYDVNEKIVELEFENFNIKCTIDHKFLTKNRGWVEAQHLTELDDIFEVS